MNCPVCNILVSDPVYYRRNEDGSVTAFCGAEHSLIDHEQINTRPRPKFLEHGDDKSTPKTY